MKRMNLKSIAIATSILILTYNSLANASENARANDHGKQTSNKFIQNTKKPFNDKGKHLYKITFNPFFVQEEDAQARQNGEFSEQEENEAAAALRSNLPLSDPEAMYQPGARAIVKKIKSKYGIKIENMTSWLGTSISTWLTPKQAEKLLAEDYVTAVTQMENTPLTFSLATTTGDIQIYNEVIPWYKISVNANDNLSTNNNIYIVDGGIDSSKVRSEINVITHRNYNNDSNPFSCTGREHAVHVASTIGAITNNNFTRGINPGQTIQSFEMAGDLFSAFGNYCNTYPPNVDQMYKAFESAAFVAETSSDFSVLSFSMNGLDMFQHNMQLGLEFRKLSNRFLMVQSAGNNYQETCSFGFNYHLNGQKNPKSNDGILVIGGFQQDGNIMTAVSDNSPFLPINGSNYGNCVEAWAPGKYINSLGVDTNGEISTNRIVSGTSFSAPIVAALASRYGNNQTRPIEREAYITNHLQDTGKFTPSWQPIRKAVYTANPSSIPKRLPVSSVFSTTNNNSNINSVIDGKFYHASYFWNPGSGITSITLDLGSIKTVTGVRLTLRSSSAPTPGTPHPVVFDVYGGITSDAPSWLTKWTEPDQADLAPSYINLSNKPAVRYIKINGVNNYSWLAYSEIEIYGY